MELNKVDGQAISEKEVTEVVDSHSLDHILNPNALTDNIQNYMKNIDQLAKQQNLVFNSMKDGLNNAEASEDRENEIIKKLAEALGMSAGELIAGTGDMADVDRTAIQPILDTIDFNEEFINTREIKSEEDLQNLKIAYLNVLLHVATTNAIYSQAKKEMAKISSEYEREISAAMATLDTVEDFERMKARKKVIIPIIKELLQKKKDGTLEGTDGDLLNELSLECKDINTQIGLLNNHAVIEYLGGLVDRLARYKHTKVKTLIDYKNNQAEKKKFVKILNNCKEVIVISAASLHTALIKIYGIDRDEEIMALMTLLYSDYNKRKELAPVKAALLNRMLIQIIRLYEANRVASEGDIEKGQIGDQLDVNKSIFYNDLTKVIENIRTELDKKLK